MKFGSVAVTDAAGAILAHSVRGASGLVRKGTILTPDDVAALKEAGISEVVVARLDASDMHEDAAAMLIASRIRGEGVRADRPFTGRVNLFSEVAGVVQIDRAAVDALNRLDPAITLATLAEYATVAPGQMVATVKIIPYGVPRALAESVPVSDAVRVARFRAHRVGLIATTLPTLKQSVMDKTRRLLDARLSPSGSAVVLEDRVPHAVGDIAPAIEAQQKAGAELIVLFGASAVSDGNDVIPAAIVEAGGEVLRIGMPVDPGNLLVLGRIGSVPVVGAPGCARSPKENGFDWILNRLLAGIPVTSDDIAALGVGGLLTEISSRPQPREPAPRIAAIVLAAGSSRRMGGHNKLVATLDGKPVVRFATEAAINSRAEPVVVVTGYQRELVEKALSGTSVNFVHNPAYAEGMATSLHAGLAAVPSDVNGVIVLLGDMPSITAAMVERLIGGFSADRIVVAAAHGQRGNPVLWPRRFIADLLATKGDQGGRSVIEQNRSAVVEIDLGEPAVFDVDTPEALAAAGGSPT